MVIPDEIRKCVGFVGYQRADGTTLFAGTVFFVGRKLDSNPDRLFVYAVTAKHVIDSIRNKGIRMVLLRLNRKAGDAVWVRTGLEDWVSNQSDLSVDVSVARFSLDEHQLDHKCFPLEARITDSIIKQHGIDVGDEVFLSGLFAPHMGRKNNLPIVRVGNIAAMQHEKVATSLGEIDAYLIEARSIGGLSGSPVFVHAGGVRHGMLSIGSAPPIFLLGLMHGHFDSQFLPLDAADTPNRAGINMGIGIVVPIEKVVEVIGQSVFRLPENAFEETLREQSSPTLDITAQTS
jgi:hypothetical protein